jgi:hypothetical protein
MGSTMRSNPARQVSQTGISASVGQDIAEGAAKITDASPSRTLLRTIGRLENQLGGDTTSGASME